MSDRRNNTNERYKHFTQELFTAGDYEQFVTFLHKNRKPMMQTTASSDGTRCDDYATNPFFQHERWSWTKYRYGDDLFGTFEYLFHKFKKGIYVQILNNELHIFLPFSNVDYRNEYASALQIDRSKYTSFEDVYKKICEFENREYYPNRVCRYPSQWYCNDGLVRYEFPLKENDSGINMLHDMLLTLCKERSVPDCEFFINKRDFPVLSLHGYEPYTALVPSKTPLWSHNRTNYLPILGMTTKDDFADIPIPTWEDWSRCSYQHDQRTFGKMFKTYSDEFHLDFVSKKPTIVFRGASTGLGTNLSNNPRLFFSKLATLNRKKQDGETLYLDIGITKWNTRPRKLNPSDPLDIIDPVSLNIPLVDTMTPAQQSQFKYILHLPGHSFAYRLSVELSMGSVIFLYPCEFSIWYLPLLKPYEHYIPLENGLSETEIFDKMDWCDAHPDECLQIAQNARDFYTTYLSYESTLNHLQSLCTKLSSVMSFDKTSFHNMSSHFQIVRDKVIASSPKDEGVISVLSRLSSEIPPELKIVHQTKHTTISECGEHLLKKKDCDMSHSHFISLVLEKSIGNLCPTFSRSCGMSDDNMTLVLPNDQSSFAMSLDSYLQSTHFRMHQFKLIMNQVLWSLKIAQAKVCFMHYDLCPWNILLYNANQDKLLFRYYDKTMSMQGHHYVAKIIDYEYSSVLYEDDVVHNIQPFFLSESHDMTTLLYNCFHIILKQQKLSKDELSWVRQTLITITGREFRNVQDMKYFLSSERKFSRLILTSETQSKEVPQCSMYNRLYKIFQTSSVNIKHEYNDWVCVSSVPRLESTEIDDFTVEKTGGLGLVNGLYTFHKMYEYYDDRFGKSFDQDSITDERKQKLTSLRKMYQDKYQQHQEPQSPSCPMPAGSSGMSTTSIDRTGWEGIRWYTFSKVPSLTIPMSEKMEQVLQVHKTLYLSRFGYYEQNYDVRQNARFLQHMYENRLWKLSQQLLSSSSQ